MNFNDLSFTPPDLGTTTISTNLGNLKIRVPCAFDFFKLQDISKQYPGLDKFVYMAESLAVEIAGQKDPVTALGLLKLDGQSFQKIISHFTEMMMILVPDLSEENLRKINSMSDEA